MILGTDHGDITLTGSDLHVTRLMLDEGQLTVEGRIDGILYSQKPARRWWMRKKPMTFFETANQSRLFLLLLYAGAAAGVLYDGCALVRRKCPRLLCVLCDAAWVLLAGACCLAALAAGDESQLRLYALLGMIYGAGIYCQGIRSALQRLFRRIKKGGRPVPK